MLDKGRVGGECRVDDFVRQEMTALLPRLVRFATALTGSRAEGEDLAQSTCERAIRFLDSWQAGTRLDSWMFRIARNLHLNQIRAAKVRNRHLREVAMDPPADVDGATAMEARITLNAVRNMVGRLPEEQRSVLMLICVEGLPYHEVAQVLDLPIGTVTSRLARARVALKTMLEQRRGRDARPESKVLP